MIEINLDQRPIGGLCCLSSIVLRFARLTLARNDLAGRWVLCRWNFDAGQGHPHPQDRSLIPKEWRSSCVAQCVAIEDEYLALSHQERVVRIAPFSAFPLPAPPRFRPGQRVRVRPNVDHSPFTAAVKSLGWHFKNGHYVYWLERKSTRYSESELELA